MSFFFNNSHPTSPHIFTRSPPHSHSPSHSHSHSFYNNLVSDLFPSPSFSFSTNARSFAGISFSPPAPFLIPIVGCTSSILPLCFTARAGTRLLLPDLALSHRRWSTVRPIGSSHYNIWLLWRRESGKVCVGVCVCGTRVCGFYWGKAMERRIEWFWMLDGMRERRGREFFAPM